MFKNDLILDIVEALGKNIEKALCDEKSDSEGIIIENLSNKDMLLMILKKIIYCGKYDEAEDTLFCFAKKNKDSDFTSICEWFYKELSLKSDEELIDNNFSRDEIKQGLEDFTRTFNK